MSIIIIRNNPQIKSLKKLLPLIPCNIKLNPVERVCKNTTEIITPIKIPLHLKY